MTEPRVGEATASLLRRLYPVVLARLVRAARDLPDAEDAVQDALARAVELWPRQGIPDRPEAWLITVAKNRYLDGLRRRQRHRAHADTLSSLAEVSPWQLPPSAGMAFGDDLLGLIFTSCDPVLDPMEAAALTLATVLGMTGTELSRLFLVSPRTMQQRLTRARRRLRSRREQLVPASRDDLRARREAVLVVLRAIFDEGYWSSGERPINPELCRLAVTLTRSLHAIERHPDVGALLGQMLLLDARRPARMRDDEAVSLAEQDRRLWDRALLEEGLSLVAQALGTGAPSTYGFEAAIAAVHAEASCAADTDWAQVATLYAGLEQLRPSPVVRVNRAVAVWRSEGPTAALSLLDETTNVLEGRPYPYLPLLRGTLLDELGRREEAAGELRRAHALARNPEEARQLLARLEGMAEVVVAASPPFELARTSD